MQFLRLIFASFCALTVCLVARAAEKHPVAKDIDRILDELQGIEEELSRDSLRPGTTQSLKVEKKPGNGKLQGEGIVISSETEASKATRELAEKLAAVQNRSREMRAKVLALQDELAARLKDKIDVDVVIQTEDAKDKRQFRFLELEAQLNDLPLARYHRPIVVSTNGALPLYKGPLPAGEYELKIKATVGELQHGAPYGVAQGKWQVEKKLKLDLAGKEPAQLVLVLGDGSEGPVLEQKTSGKKE